MLPSQSKILAEKTSTLIKIFYVVVFLILCYTIITYNGLESNE